MKKGIYKNITFEDYTEIEALNASTLKPYLASPLHGLEREFEEFSDTPALQLGRWVHEAVLEGTNWAQRSVCWEGGRRAGKAWDAFQMEHEGKHILKPEEFEKVQRIQEAIYQHDAAEDLIFGEDILFYLPDAELTVVGDVNGTLAKARLDVWDKLRGLIVDLKTTAKLEHEGQIRHSIEAYGYDLQAAWYWDVLASVLGLDDAEFRFSFVFVCTSAPYDVAVVNMDPLWLEIGREKYQTSMTARAAAMDARTGGYRPDGRFKEPIDLVPLAVGLDMAGVEVEELELV